jgi:hypothetical protein
MFDDYKNDFKNRLRQAGVPEGLIPPDSLIPPKPLIPPDSILPPIRKPNPWDEED